MNYYLIDYENVKADGIKNLKDITPRDSIILFYSEQCKNISLDVIDSIMKLNLSFSSFKASVGTKNALDFQLSSYLGYLIGQHGYTDSKYYIVSKDKGYDCLCTYWKALGADVKRITFSPETAAKKSSGKGGSKSTGKAGSNSTGKATSKSISASNAQTDSLVEVEAALISDTDTSIISELIYNPSAAEISSDATSDVQSSTDFETASDFNSLAASSSIKEVVPSVGQTAPPASDQATKSSKSKGTTVNNKKMKSTDQSSNASKSKASKVKASDMATLEEMQKLLGEEDSPEEVLEIFNQYKTKVAINNGLSKKYKDSKRASMIYKKLKPLLKEKNKS